ncbi:MAG TPA: hypothetical protein VJU86_15830 [Pyrinomonadaceae bacterium]|nr:hypothetical protein [Pyrinomonadaceae bacterium]
MKSLRHKYIRACVQCLLLAITPCWVAGQSLAPDLQVISDRVVSHVREEKPEWKHKTATPPIPPGGQPSTEVAIHFWTAEKCVTAEVVIEGASLGSHPVSCGIKLAIDRSPSASVALRRLTEFAISEPSAITVPVGDDGYAWRGSELVFIKGRFTFWFGVNMNMRVGNYTYNKDFLAKLAKGIADDLGAVQ